MENFKSLYFCLSLALTLSIIQGAEIRLPNDKEEDLSQKITNRATAIPITFDAFISYRRVPSRSLAMLLKVMLKQKGIEAFLDVDDLQGGLYHDQLMAKIDEAPNFVIVLSKTSLDRCIGDTNFTDILHQEMRQAVNGSKRIIPIFDEYDFPNPANYSQVIQTVVSHQGVVWTHHLAEGSLDRLIQYLDLSAKTTTTAAKEAVASFRNLVETELKRNYGQVSAQR